jgi:hypothetical protein
LLPDIDTVTQYRPGQRPGIIVQISLAMVIAESYFREAALNYI